MTRFYRWHGHLVRLTSRKDPSGDPESSLLRGMVYVTFETTCPFDPPIRGLWVSPSSLQKPQRRARLKRARPRARPQWRR